MPNKNFILHGGKHMKKQIKINLTEPNRGVLNYAHLLDAPAGKHGFVESRDGHLYFGDGVRARFLGFNIAARSNTPDHATAEKIAERFASLGVNLIRMHAADAPISDEPTTWSSCRQAPLLDYDRNSTRQFHPEGLDRFDYLFAKLKEKGIYIHFDLLVAREFVEGDSLDYPGHFPSTLKRYTMYNKRLIELQKEYAQNFLTHVNPYTGLAYVDDPAIVTVQINNEDSAIKGDMGADLTDQMKPYRDEVQRRFNYFLLAKYETRDRMKEAWTYDGICALGDNEDPAQGTVEVIMGDFHQPTNDPMGQWDAPCGPARYHDFMEFGILMNQNFYQDMKNFLISLGVKVPIVASNLVAGAADVYGHTVGDMMENNTYFNHPLLPIQNGNNLVFGPTEYVSVNPLTMQTGVGAMATSLLNLAAVAVVADKPFMVSEWNEYGLHPFHSTSFVHTVAYACLNDWDGLILYNHHTSEKAADEPEDEIWSVFDAYNDPALICQWGFMATMFLKGLVSAAKNRVDVVYTKNDLGTLPPFHAMPTTILPYITSMRNVFLDGDDQYRSDADVAINAGFLNGGDLSLAKHSVYYAWSPYRDALRKYRDENRLKKAAAGTQELQPGVHLGQRTLVFDEIRNVAGSGDYRDFAAILDSALKKWQVLPEGTGYVDGKLISDTREIEFDPDHARFWVRSPSCSYFSGAPEERIALSSTVAVQSKNERITLALLPLGGGEIDDAKEYVLTALGATGTDQASYTPGPELMPGIRFTVVRLDGKLYAETLEGTIFVQAKAASLEILSPVGEVLAELQGETDENGVFFSLCGAACGVHYHLIIKQS
jgi:hypothetical protein